jgi:hypothetical protein
MIVVVIFNIVQAFVAGYALWRGGAPERSVSLLLLVASLSTWLVPARHLSYHHIFWPVLWIDLALLLGLAGITAFADRFWPMWITACQLVTVAGHGVRAYDPELWAMAYWFITGSIAYPMLVILVVGTWRHHRRLPSGVEFAWTAQRHCHDRLTTQAEPPS